MVGKALENFGDDALGHLIEDHRKLENQPLHLAVSYHPCAAQEDLVLFEVSENFAGNQVNEEKEFMKVWVAQSPEFTVIGATNFYLLLTNPVEFEVGLTEGWPEVLELKESIQSGFAVAHHMDDLGQRWWKQVSGG